MKPVDEIDFEAALAHQLRTPVSAMKAASANLRRNLRGLLEDLGQIAPHHGAPRTPAFLARVMDEPPPPPITGLLPRDRMEVIVLRLRAAGLGGELATTAASLLRGGWDTYMEEITPLLSADPGATLSLLETTARMRSSLAAIESSLVKIEGLSAALKALTCPIASAEPIDLAEGLEDVAAMLRQGLAPGGQIRVRIVDPPQVAAPAHLLHELWVALLANALEATSAAGCVILEARRDERGDAMVQVIDDGPGIGAEDLPRIFDSGFTTRAADGGTGLGLALARRIAARLAGTLTVESRPGRTCFTVGLPAARQAARMGRP